MSTDKTPEYVDAPPDFDPQPHILKAFDEIKYYTAIFILEDGRVGSGVFVNTCGLYGILTAYHVAEPLLAVENFALCVGPIEHGLWLKSANFEHIPIGVMNPDPAQQILGPDLSFVAIRDTRLLETLKSRMSFCYLENQKMHFLESPVERQPWVMAGSPFEAIEILRDEHSPKGKLTKVGNWVGLGAFDSRVIRNGFDYVQIETWAGINDNSGGSYPGNYQGMSGGGFWIVPFEIDENNALETVAHAKPVLAGIIFYQSAVADQKRTITGHGFDSIYKNVIATVKARQAQPS